MGVAENKKFVEERWVPAAVRGDVEAIVDCFAEDGTFTFPGTTPLSGTYDKAAFRKLMAWLQPHVPNPEQAIANPGVNLVVAEGDTVAIFGNVDKPVGGQQFSLQFCHLFRFAPDGRIRHLTDFLDSEILNVVYNAHGSELDPGILPGAKRPPSASPNDHKRFVEEKWVPAAGNIDAMADCLTDDVRYTLIGDTPLSGTYDKAGYRELQNWVFAKMPKGQMPRPELTVFGEGERACLLIHFGEPVNNYSLQVLRFAPSGKIREVIGFLDTEWLHNLWRQSGSDFQPRRIARER